MTNKFPVFCLLVSIFYFSTVQAQEPQLQSIEDVISGIDTLLQEIDGATSPVVNESPPLPAENRPFGLRMN